ncbi:MAG: eukaryotic integral membrane protein-domain-containing protein, partial [Olpidium bornovanus]
IEGSGVPILDTLLFPDPADDGSPIQNPFQVTAVSLLGFYLRNSRSPEKEAQDEPDVLPMIALVVSVVSLLLCGKYLERVWGSRELLLFCAVSGVVPMFAAFLFFVFEYVGTNNPDYLYSVQANGMTAVLCGFSVAFKHLVPEHTVKLFAGAVSVRVKYFPFAFLALHLVLAILTGLLPRVVMAASGLMTSWVYVRFFRMQDGTRGDRSETFSFASFFPELIQ